MILLVNLILRLSLVAQLDQDVSKVRENELLFIYEMNPLSRAQKTDEDEKDTTDDMKYGKERVDGKEDDEDEEKEGGLMKERKEEHKEKDEKNDGEEEEEEEEEYLKERRGGEEDKEAEEDTESKEVEGKYESGSLDIGGRTERGKLRVGSKPPRGPPRSMLPPPPPPHLPQSRAPPLLPLAFQGYGYGYNKRGSSSVLVSCVHRALERVESYFLNPFRCVA